MQARRYGRIVNIDSEVAHRPPPGRSAYAAAKNAQIGLTAGAGLAELAPFGITVNTVAPGFVPVERHADVPDGGSAGLSRLGARRADGNPRRHRPRGGLPRRRPRRLRHRPAHRGRRRPQPRLLTTPDSFPCPRRSALPRPRRPGPGKRRNRDAEQAVRGGQAALGSGPAGHGAARRRADLTMSPGVTSPPSRGRSTTPRPTAGGLPAMWAVPKHGARTGCCCASTAAGFVSGSIYTHRKMFGHLAKATGARALLVDYRLLPEAARYPAQVRRWRPPTAGCSTREPGRPRRVRRRLRRRLAGDHRAAAGPGPGSAPACRRRCCSRRRGHGSHRGIVRHQRDKDPFFHRDLVRGLMPRLPRRGAATPVIRWSTRCTPT